MRNFFAGLLLGILVTYWYLTQGGDIRELAEQWWARASAPPRFDQRLP